MFHERVIPQNNNSNRTAGEILAETRRNMQNNINNPQHQFTGSTVLDPNMWRFDNLSNQSSRNMVDQARMEPDRYVVHSLNNLQS